MQTARGTSITESTVDSSRRRARSRWLLGIVVLIGLAVDLITKQLAVRTLDPANPPVYLGGLLRLQLIRNSGAAFSLGSGYTMIFALLAIGVLIFVLIVLVPKVAHTGWAVALGLLVAGVAGNLTDRIFRPPGPLRGHVVDFLQLPYWAIFNVADMCVSAAAVLIIVLAMIKNVSVSGERYPRKGEARTGSPAAVDDDQSAAGREGDS